MHGACAILLSVACRTVQHFYTLSHNRYDFQEKKNVIEHKMFGFNFSTIFVWNNSHSTKKWARCDKKIYIVLHVKCLNFLDRFSKNTHILNFVKILPVGAELLHADRQTEIVAFRYFANAPKTIRMSLLFTNMRYRDSRPLAQSSITPSIHTRQCRHSFMNS
jgi:hypothetical protein